MQPKANKSGFRSDANRPWQMHDKIMNVSEQKFIFLLVSLTENTPVTSLPCHQFRWYFSGMWWADWILPSSSIKGTVQLQQQQENSVIIYSPLSCSKRGWLSCFLAAQKVNFQRIYACPFPYNEIWRRIIRNISYMDYFYDIRDAQYQTSGR